MQARSSNPRVSNLLLTLTVVEVLVLLVAGGGLLFLPDYLTEIWPWQLAPFDAASLGAIYLASMASAAMLVLIGRWSPARVVLPMILLFTAVLAVLTAIYRDRFYLSSPATWLWLILYYGIPINAAVHLWLYRRWAPARLAPLGPGWRGVLLLLGLGYGAYGLGLLIAPESFSAFWPWRLDRFHAQMYSVAFLTPALGLLLLYRAAAWAEVFSLGLSLALGGLSILGLVTVDLRVQRVDWRSAGTWLWIGLFAGFLAAGVGLLLQARRLPRPRGRLTGAGYMISVRYLALIIGIAFTAAGIAGFLPLFTSPPPPEAPALAVHASHGYLLGLFPINVLHNLFHLLIGISGLALWSKANLARLYLRIFAAALAFLAVAGLVPGLNLLFGLAPIYGHDVWLHGVEALVAGYAGWVMPTEGEQRTELEAEAALSGM